jgi:hypothetical protein
VKLQTHSPTNEEGQRLNWWGKKETFPVKIQVDFYFSDIAAYERDKTIALSLNYFEKSVKFKNYFLTIKYYIAFNYSIQ